MNDELYQEICESIIWNFGQMDLVSQIICNLWRDSVLVADFSKISKEDRNVAVALTLIYSDEDFEDLLCRFKRFGDACVASGTKHEDWDDVGKGKRILCARKVLLRRDRVLRSLEFLEGVLPEWMAYSVAEFY